jgi:hypothetical protein
MGSEEQFSRNHTHTGFKNSVNFLEHKTKEDTIAAPVSKLKLTKDWRSNEKMHSLFAFGVHSLPKPT